MRRIGGHGVAIVCLGLCVAGCAAQQRRLRDERRFGHYTVRIWSDSAFEESLEILRRGRRVCSVTSRAFRLGHINAATPPDLDERIRMGRDITGDGRPNLVVSEWTGGAHCDYVYHVFEIGQQFRRLAVINAEHSSGSCFKDLDGDSIPEFLTNDWTFAYWKTCFAESAAPAVTLQWREGAYRLMKEDMIKPAPSEQEIATEAKAVQASGEWGIRGGIATPPPALWRYMLELIYSGNADPAWRFFDLAWKRGAPGKEQFRREFTARLAGSPYGPEVQKLGEG